MMSEKTFISIEFWQLVTFAILIVGGYWKFAQKQFSDYQKQQDERQKIQDEINKNTASLSKEFLEFSAQVILLN